jgi:hypothetical protein
VITPQDNWQFWTRVLQHRRYPFYRGHLICHGRHPDHVWAKGERAISDINVRQFAIALNTRMQ